MCKQLNFSLSSCFYQLTIFLLLLFYKHLRIFMTKNWLKHKIWQNLNSPLYKSLSTKEKSSHLPTIYNGILYPTILCLIWIDWNYCNWKYFIYCTMHNLFRILIIWKDLLQFFCLTFAIFPFAALTTARPSAYFYIFRTISWKCHWHKLALHCIQFINIKHTNVNILPTYRFLLHMLVYLIAVAVCVVFAVIDFTG